ncbi:MAG: SusC/RagA family TonB-linked outer membrane protein [Balneolaceae bacterium]
MRKGYQSRLLATFVALLLCAPLAMAQYTVSGKVTDQATGEALVGVSIFNAATMAGVSTNIDGEYTLQLPAGETTLRFSSIGYVTKNVDVSGSTGQNVTLDVILRSDIANLDELVVTGLASSVKRSNLANSVGSISADDIAGKSQPASIDNALQGKLPGVQISSYSGAPGGGFNVQLRGVTTLGAGGSQPLYIIDGVYVNNEQLSTGRSSVSGAGGTSQDDTANRLADLNPDDIASIEVLKGASAAAIYGQRANAGVIIINTKRGTSGETLVSVKQEIGYSSALNLIGRTDWTAARIDKLYGAGSPKANLEKQRLSDAEAAGNVLDLEEFIYGNKGLINNTQINVSGGNEKTRFFISGGFDLEDGIIKKTGFNRNSIRANIDHSISQNIRIRSNSNYVNTESERGFTGNQNNTGGSIGYSLASHPNYSYNIIKKNADGSYPDTPYFGENPLRLIDVAQNNQEVNRFLQSLTLEADLLRRDNTLLSLKIDGGLDYTSANSMIYFPEYMQYQRTAANFPGDVIHTTQEVMNTNLQVVALFNTTVTSDMGFFDLTSQAGLTRFNQSMTLDRIRGQGLLPGQTNVGNAAQVTAAQNFTEVSDFGIFLQQEVSFADKIIATIGGRWDKSSLNLDVDNYYFYPKASAAVNISNFDFWNLNSINQVKLRVAYGETGGLPNFGGIFSSLGGTNIGTSGGAVAPTSDVDPKLRPERAKELEYGLDLGFFDGRVALELTHYNKTIEDLILPLVPAPSTGVGRITTNAAEMENVGTEIGLTLIPVQSKNFTWNSRVLWWKNTTELTKLAIPAQTNTFYASPTFGASRFEVGVSPTGIYGFVPGKAEREIVGDLQPDFQMSFGNDFNFLKNFTASFLVHWSHGAKGINLSQLLTDGPGNTADFFDKDDNIVQREGGTLSFMKDASYIKLREASLYYTVPRSALQSFANNTLKSVKVGVTGTNLLMFTDYTGYDPEVNATGRSPLSQSVDISPYPTARKVLFSVKVDL